MKKVEMKPISMMKLDPDLEMKLGFGRMLAEGAQWPQLFLMVGIGDIYNQASQLVLRYIRSGSKLRDIAKRYGFYWMEKPASVTFNREAAEYLYARTVNGKWVPWIEIRGHKQFIIHGDTRSLDLWLSKTRPELTGTHMEQFIADVNAAAEKYGTQIQPHELIAAEDHTAREQSDAGIAG